MLIWTGSPGTRPCRAAGTPRHRHPRPSAQAPSVEDREDRGDVVLRRAARAGRPNPGGLGSWSALSPVPSRRARPRLREPARDRQPPRPPASLVVTAGSPSAEPSWSAAKSRSAWPTPQDRRVDRRTDTIQVAVETSITAPRPGPLAPRHQTAQGIELRLTTPSSSARHREVSSLSQPAAEFFRLRDETELRHCSGNQGADRGQEEKERLERGAEAS